MLSGKRQHWVGLARRVRKNSDWPVKDFIILGLLALLVTLVWVWYGGREVVDMGAYHGEALNATIDERVAGLDELRAKLPGAGGEVSESDRAGRQAVLDDIREDIAGEGHAYEPSVTGKNEDDIQRRIDALDAIRGSLAR